MVKPFNVIILAAGFGTRLAQFGKVTPKGLIPSGKTSILGHILHDLTKLNPNTMVLITNHLHAPIYSRWLQTARFSQINLIDNGITLPSNRNGALKDAQLVINQFSWNESPVLIAPSDTLYDFSLTDFIQFAQSHPDGLSTIFRAFKSKALIEDRLGCGVIDGDQLLRFVEKPHQAPSVYGAIPFYYYPATITSLITQYVNLHPSLESIDAPGSLIPWILKEKYPVYAHVITADTLDVGTPADLVAAQHFKVQ